MRPTQVGIIGCGNISERYLANAPLFARVAVTKVADINPDAANARAKAFGVQAVPIEEIYTDPDLDILVNLTVPAVHAKVSLRAIGRVAAGTATMMSRGMEHWHPDPGFFYAPGGGPVLDLGPYYIAALVNLIGPVASVVAVQGQAFDERLVTATGPKQGKTIPVTTPTTQLAVLRFASGAIVSVNMSWGVFKHGHTPIELYGTEGSIQVPDPNVFAGDLRINQARGEWRPVSIEQAPLTRPNQATATGVLSTNYRMLGVAELAAAVSARPTTRLSGDFALHCLEVMEAISRPLTWRTRLP